MIGKHLKRNIVLINIILILISGCLGNNSSTMIKTKEKSMYDNNMSKKIATRSFIHRTDIITVYWQLQNAFTNIRSRIDAEFGQRKWENADPPAQYFSYCNDGNKVGRNDSRKQGAFYGLNKENFRRLKQIVKEEVEPYGFTEVVDISDSNILWTDFYNIKDGGYVGVTMTLDKLYFGMLYSTDCRPVPKGLDPETSRVVPGDGPPSGTGSSTAPNASPSS